MGKYIPGNPRFIVQNMPGGGSMIAANYVYTVATPDGLTLGSVQPSLCIEQLAGRKEVQFDWAKFAWIGNPESIDRIFFMRADTPYKTLEDIRKAPEPPKCAAPAPGTLAYYFPRLLEDALGLKVNIVTGYGGAVDINLAIERGKVHCFAFSVQGFFSTEPSRTWAKTGFVRVLIQGGKKRDPRLPDVPTIWELMDRHKTPEQTKRLVRVLLAPEELGRVLFGPPGIPGDRVKILREAFMKTMNDPELLAEAKKRALGVNPTGGEELEAMARDLMTQPPEVIERMKKFLAK
jgi:tripartite-type tricarboxylate transporter receptor subunit TctC